MISGPTYTTINQHIEQSQVTVDGVSLRQTQITLAKEVDGVRVPMRLKEVLCSPPGSLPLVLDYATISETLGENNERKILSQFISDANSFEGALSA